MKNKNFKPWIILILCCLMISASVGLSVNSSGVFYTPVSESLGILRGSFAMHMTIFSLTTATTALFIPKLINKFAYKKILIVGLILAFISTFLMGVSKNLISFYILGGLRGISTGVFSIAPITIIINGWFYKNNGLATSIALGFSGIASSVFSPILSSLIESFGWEKTYFIKAFLILFLCLPSIIFSFSINSKEEGKLPYGYTENFSNKNSIIAAKNFTFLNIGFINLFIFALFITIISGITQHLPGFGNSIGYNSTMATKLLSAGMIGNVLFKIIIGALSDKIGPIKSILIMMSINVLGTLIILNSSSFILILIGATLFGASYSVHAVGLPLLTKYLFGLENYSKVFPSISFSSNIGVALSLSLVGYIYDFTGSYRYSFLLALTLNIIGLIFIFIILKTNNKLSIYNKKSL